MKVDALTCYIDKVSAQDSLKEKHQTRALLLPNQVDPYILTTIDHGLNSIELVELALIEFNKSITMVKQVLQANRESELLEALCKQAYRGDDELMVYQDLLLYYRRLVVPNHLSLQADLIREAHDQLSTAYPGRNKTYYLLKPQYFQRGMFIDVTRYVCNYYAYQRSYSPRDKALGLLQLLLVLDYPQ